MPTSASTISVAVATAVAHHAPASAVSPSSHPRAQGGRAPAYPWYYPTRRASDLEVMVDTRELEVIFEEPSR